MRNNNKIVLFSLICTTLLYSNSENKKSVNLDSVIVTANKIEENLQNVPQSITVIDEHILEEKGIKNIVDIINEIPNMTSMPDHGTMVNFRGLNSSLFTNNNPIVIYIDGVAITDRFGYDISIANAKRVEILRGPQGTLYGKDAIGGVINIITKEPTNQHKGEMGIEYGNYNTSLATLNINGPIKNNKLFYGLNAQVKNTDSWVTNDYNGDDKANKTKNEKYSGFLLYKPTDNLSTKLILSKYEMEKNWGNIQSLPYTSPLSAFSMNGVKNVNFDVPTIEKTVTDSQSFVVDYDFDDMTLTSVTTRKEIDLEADFDSDFGIEPSFKGYKQFNYINNKELTQELRLSSVKENIRWVSGVYFDKTKRDIDAFGMQIQGMQRNSVSENDSDTKAIFGQVTFSIFPKTELTLGGRYQKIKKDIDVNTYIAPIGANSSPMFSLKNEKTWNTFIPKAAIAYKLNENITPFISFSKGYMPGGYNFSYYGGGADNNSFDPQISTNYETGIKGVIDDLSFSASIFRMDIKDIHIYKQEGSVWLTDNAKKAHSQGIELDFNYFPNEEWEISGAIGFIDAKYDDYDAGNKKYDNENIENTPKHTASLSIAYHNPSGYYGRVNIKNTGSTSFFNSGNQNFLKQGSHTVADIKVGYKFLDFDIYGYVKNLTDEEYITSYKNIVHNGIATFNDPRTFGLGLKYKF